MFKVRQIVLIDSFYHRKNTILCNP